jgi:hypothetical protein
VSASALTCHLRWCDGRRCTCGYEQQRETDAELLRAVANAARNLVAGARDIDMRHAKVDEPSLVSLEAALAAAGYDTAEET